MEVPLQYIWKRNVLQWCRKMIFYRVCLVYACAQAVPPKSRVRVAAFALRALPSGGAATVVPTPLVFTIFHEETGKILRCILYYMQSSVAVQSYPTTQK